MEIVPCCRFEVQIEVGLPDETGRYDILTILYLYSM